MVNVTMRVGPGGRERMQETDFNEGRRVMRVLPSSDNIRKYLKHPGTRVGFGAEGSAEWPNDAFTKRRIRDGDVRLEPVAALEAPEAREAHEEPEAEQQVVDKKSGAKAPDPAAKEKAAAKSET